MKRLSILLPLCFAAACVPISSFPSPSPSASLVPTVTPTTTRTSTITFTPTPSVTPQPTATPSPIPIIGFIDNLMWSPDGRLLMAGTTNFGFYFMNPDTLATYHFQPAAGRANEFTADGALFAWSDADVNLLRLEDFKVITQFTGQQGFASSLDGRSAVTIGFTDKQLEIHVLDRTNYRFTNRNSFAIHTSKHPYLETLALSPDGTIMGIAMYNLQGGRGFNWSCDFFSTQDGTSIRSLDNCIDFHFSLNWDRLIVQPPASGFAFIYRVTSLSRLGFTSFGTMDIGNSYYFAQDDIYASLCLSVSNGNMIKVSSMNESFFLMVWPLAQGPFCRDQYQGLAMSPDGTRLAVIVTPTSPGWCTDCPSEVGIWSFPEGKFLRWSGE